MVGPGEGIWEVGDVDEVSNESVRLPVWVVFNNIESFTNGVICREILGK
jgi:hypothetical protein